MSTIVISAGGDRCPWGANVPVSHVGTGRRLISRLLFLPSPRELCCDCLINCTAEHIGISRVRCLHVLGSSGAFSICSSMLLRFYSRLALCIGSVYTGIQIDCLSSKKKESYYYYYYY